MKRIFFILVLGGLFVQANLFADETTLLISTFSSGYARLAAKSDTLHSMIGQAFVVPSRSDDETLMNGFVPAINHLITGVEYIATNIIPSAFELFQNYPNPFNPETKINYNIAKATDVKLEIYNVQGQLVRVLVNEKKVPGQYSIVWNGRNNQGQQLPSGIYLFQLKCEEYTRVRILSFIR